MATGTGCALCGRQVSYRLDLTFSETSNRDVSSYRVQALLRGVLICAECQATATIAQLMERVGGGVAIIHGCLVQCADRPPWWLRRAIPGSARWNKVVCPNCGGRASVQHVGEVVEKPESALRTGFRQALQILSWRQLQEWEEQDLEEGDYDSDPDYLGSSHIPGPKSIVLGSDEPVDSHPQRPERAIGSGHPVAELPPQRQETVTTATSAETAARLWQELGGPE